MPTHYLYVEICDTIHIYLQSIPMWWQRLKKIKEYWIRKREIVKEIESRLSVCDKIEETIENSLLQAEALRLSIIKKAFEGKLVPQNPSDEPAEKLLERIRATKGKEKPEKKVKVEKKPKQKRKEKIEIWHQRIT